MHALPEFNLNDDLRLRKRAMSTDENGESGAIANNRVGL